MNALLASIFSPLKETVASRNGPALDRLEGNATPVKQRDTARRIVNRKSVSFDMTPKKQDKHTPPRLRRARQTPQAPVDLGPIKTRKRKAAEEIPQDETDTGKEDVNRKGTEEPLVAAPDAPVADVSANAEEPPSTTPEANKEAEEDEEDEEEGAQKGGEFRFKKFLDHRWEDSTIMIHVEWDNGDRTWEPETTLHTDTPQTLLEYWAQQPAGRPENPGRPGFYEIHAIRKHSRDRKRLFVEWVGYGPKDGTWEPARVVEEAAPAIWTEYWGSLPRPKRRKRAS